MAHSAKVIETPTGWTQGKCYGFVLSENGEYYRALFEIIETRDTASYLFGNPLKRVEINKLAIACGKPAIQPGQAIELPDIKDTDKMGWDTEIQIKIKEKNGYYNVTDFKPGDGSFRKGPF